MWLLVITLKYILSRVVFVQSQQHEMSPVNSQKRLTRYNASYFNATWILPHKYHYVHTPLLQVNIARTIPESSMLSNAITGDKSIYWNDCFLLVSSLSIVVGGFIRYYVSYSFSDAYTWLGVITRPISQSTAPDAHMWPIRERDLMTSRTTSTA